MQLPSARSRWSPVRTLIVVLCVAAVGGVFVLSRPPAPHIPVPSDIAKLEPQLRNYLALQIQGIVASPREPEGHSRLGMVYAVNGLWREAQGCFSNYHRLKPQDPLGLLYIGVSRLELGQLPAARDDFKELVRQFPDFPQGHFRKGDVHLRMGEFDEARQSFESLCRLAPDEWRGPAGVGEALLKSNRAAEAVPWLEKARTLEPSSKVVRNVLGIAYRAVGRAQESKTELQLGLDAVTSPMPDPWLQNARQHMRLLQDLFALADDFTDSGKPGEAVLILEQVLPFHPTNEMAINKLAIAYNRAATPEKAVPLLTELLQRNPRHLPGIITLSHSFHALGQFSNAIAAASRAVEISPGTVQSHLAMANALLGVRNEKEAADSLRRALELDPRNARIHFELGELLWISSRNGHEALKSYAMAVELDPLFHDALARCVEIHLTEKRKSDAANGLDRLARQAPGHPAISGLKLRLSRLEGTAPNQ